MRPQNIPASGYWCDRWHWRRYAPGWVPGQIFIIRDKALENPDLRIIFKDQLQTLADLVVLYKERSRAEKDYLAYIVWYFAYLFPQILLAAS